MGSEKKNAVPSFDASALGVVNVDKVIRAKGAKNTATAQDAAEWHDSIKAQLDAAGEGLAYPVGNLAAIFGTADHGAAVLSYIVRKINAERKSQNVSGGFVVQSRYRVDAKTRRKSTNPNFREGFCTVTRTARTASQNPKV